MRTQWVGITSEAWEFMAGGEKIIVFKKDRGGWFMNFAITGITPLEATEVGQAKKEAISRVIDILDGILDDIR